MSSFELSALQRRVQNQPEFIALEDYLAVGYMFLDFIVATLPTRIISPSQTNYIFYQYSEQYAHSITRPLNTNLFYESSIQFQDAFQRFILFLDDLREYQEAASQQPGNREFIASQDINRVVYTIQQAIGCIGDSFSNQNQSRKLVGQHFERFVKLIIKAVGLECEPRRINLPIPGFPGYKM